MLRFHRQAMFHRDDLGGIDISSLVYRNSVTKIFVGNLANSTSERELRSSFERFGRVTSVQLIHDRQSGAPRGFAFVGMSFWEDADEAIVRLNGSSLSGRQIVVSQAQSVMRIASAKKPLDPFLALL